MKLNKVQAHRLDLIIVIVILGTMFLFALADALGFDFSKVNQGYWWLMIGGLLLLAAWVRYWEGPFPYGKNFSTRISEIKEIKVIDGFWTCPSCNAKNPDKFLAIIDATMRCEECGQWVVREPDSVNLSLVSPQMREQTRVNERKARLKLTFFLIFIYVICGLLFLSSLFHKSKQN